MMTLKAGLASPYKLHCDCCHSLCQVCCLFLQKIGDFSESLWNFLQTALEQVCFWSDDLLKWYFYISIQKIMFNLHFHNCTKDHWLKWITWSFLHQSVTNSSYLDTGCSNIGDRECQVMGSFKWHLSKNVEQNFHFNILFVISDCCHPHFSLLQSPTMFWHHLGFLYLFYGLLSMISVHHYSLLCLGTRISSQICSYSRLLG